MTMAQEDFVSLECAKLLKEKGFDEPCCGYYHLCNNDEFDEEDSFELAPNGDFQNSLNNYRVGAPTLSEAQKWLRHTHNIHISVVCTAAHCWAFIGIKYTDLGHDFIAVSDEEIFSYESALNAGIIEALKMIEV